LHADPVEFQNSSPHVPHVARHTTAEVIGIPVAHTQHGEPDWIWLATNLPTRVAATTVGAFYLLRWTIENLFKIPPARVQHPYPEARFRVRHPR
jgi:hypothetical protein